MMKLKAIMLILSLFSIILFAGKRKSISQPDPVWPSPPAEARIKWIGEIRDEYDVLHKKQSKFIDILSGKKNVVSKVRRPIDVAVDSDGTIYVADLYQGILKVSENNKVFSVISTKLGMRLKNPCGIALDSKFLYLSDSALGMVFIMDKDGNLIRVIGKEAGIKFPVGLAVDESENRLFVVDNRKSEVFCFNPITGKLMNKFGGDGKDPGMLHMPTYINVLPDRKVIISDTGNFRVQILTYEGKAVHAFGQIGDITGSFSRPKGVASDPDGNIYVVDGAFQNIQVFNQNGRILTYIGEGGNQRRKGEFSLPVGIFISKNNKIYVADQYNSRIQILEYIPEKKGGAKEEAIMNFHESSNFWSFSNLNEGGIV